MGAALHSQADPPVAALDLIPSSAVILLHVRKEAKGEALEGVGGVEFDDETVKLRVLDEIETEWN
jgi:hypothetical protein